MGVWAWLSDASSSTEDFLKRGCITAFYRATSDVSSWIQGTRRNQEGQQFSLHVAEVTAQKVIWWSVDLQPSYSSPIFTNACPAEAEEIKQGYFKVLSHLNIFFFHLSIILHTEDPCFRSWHLHLNENQVTEWKESYLWVFAKALNQKKWNSCIIFFSAISSQCFLLLWDRLKLSISLLASVASLYLRETARYLKSVKICHQLEETQLMNGLKERQKATTIGWGLRKKIISVLLNE